MDKSPKRILLVEDDDASRELMSRLLRSHGYDVTSVSTKADAIRMCFQGDFDLLLGDILLPDGDGMDMIREARLLVRVKAIAISGIAEELDWSEMRSAGYCACLSKPVDLDVLYREIEDVLDESTL